MANHGEAYSPDINCVFSETNIDTRLALLLHKDDTVSHFKDNFSKEHMQSFPETGEIRVSAVKVRRGDHFYHFPDSMIVSKVFQGISGNWFIYVDVVKVPEREAKTKKRKIKSSCDVEKVDNHLRGVVVVVEQDLEKGDTVNEMDQVTLVASAVHSDKKGEADKYASVAQGADKLEVETKKRNKKKKKKQSGGDHNTDNKDDEKDNVSVPRNENEPELDREEDATCLLSSVLVPNCVAPTVLTRCSCEGQRDRKLVVFDLNGILADIVKDECTDPFVPDGRISNRSVFRRPFVASFLDFCFERFSVGIWSSRRIGLDYMTNIVMGKHARNLLFSLDQHMCITTKFKTLDNSSKPLFLKDLRRVWNRFGSCSICKKQKYDETNTLLVDDSPHKALCNPPYTGIFPSPYQYRDREDSALAPNGELRKYMERLADAENVQKFVEQNPFGQIAINERHESWEFYSKVFDAFKQVR